MKDESETSKDNKIERENKIVELIMMFKKEEITLNNIIVETEHQNSMAIALRMIAHGKISNEEIANYCDLTLEEVKFLRWWW